MTTETPKPVEVTQADRDAAADCPKALWELCNCYGSGVSGYSGFPCGECGGSGGQPPEWLTLMLARHRLSTRPEAQSLPTVSGIAELDHGAMVWAAKHGGGEPKPWQNGNSTAEDIARQVADKIAALSPVQKPN